MRTIKQQRDLMILVHSQQSYSGETENFRKWIMRWVGRNVRHARMYHADGNIYIQKGDAAVFPCIVAHIDTVHKVNEHVKVFLGDNNLFAIDTVNGTQYGIGGDDKVGVWIALEMLLAHKHIKIALFRDEEIGCKGSALAHKDFFTNCGFVLQADRKGYGEFVDNISGTELMGDDFREAIEDHMANFGYEFTRGMMTDVQELKESFLSVACANISCGYYRPHCDDEIVKVDEALSTMHMINDIVSTCGGRFFDHQYVPTVYQYKYGKLYTAQDYMETDTDRFDVWDDEAWKNRYVNNEHACKQCGGTHTQFDLKTLEMYCFDCTKFTTTTTNDADLMKLVKQLNVNKQISR